MTKKLLLLLFCLSCMFGIKAQRTVSGVVTSSDDGQPMIGVTVRIEGTTIGTFTDVDGRYVIKNVPETATNVVFSFIGYHMQSLPIAKQVDVVMKPMAEMLQEVVVTAMAVERQKKSLGYAVQEVKAESLTQAAVDNVANALQGKVAGLQITQAGGSLGASQRISIRGNSSLGSNSPLIVIDGIPMDNSSMLVGNHYNSAYDLGTGLGDINPEDIESVSVLKGGSAAIYGMRAGNGVILITTKKGHAGKKHSATITYDGSLTFDRVSNLPPFQDKYGVGEYGSEYNYNMLKQSGVFVDPNLTYKQFAEGGWMAYDENGQEVDGSYYGMGFSYEDGYGSGLNDWSIGSWGPRLDIGLKIKQYNSPIVDGVRQPTDWVSHPDNVASFFETGISQSHQFSISNAGEQGSYRASIGYTGQSGILPNTDMDRYNFGLTGKYKFNTKWWLDASTHFTRTESKNRTNVGYSDFNPLMTFTQWFGRQVDMADLKAHYEEKMSDGSYYNWTPGFVNPYFASYNNTNPYYRNRLISKASLWFQPNQYLKFEGRAGYDISHRMFEERIAYTAPGFNGGYTQFDVFDENLILDAIAYYDRTWNKLTLNALAGANYTNEVYRSSSIGSSTANGLTIPGLFSVSNIAGKPVVAADHSHIRSNSLYANAVLGWNNQYYLEGSVREDWHSTIAPAFFYPSLSGTWIVTETFSKLRSDAFNYLKIRLNWANIGNATSAYRTGIYFTPNGVVDGVSLYALPSTLNNPDLRPENINTSEAGFEAAFWDNRIRLDFTAYYKTTTDQILTLQTSSASGYVYKMINAGNVRNTGMEAVLSVDVFRNKDGFNWKSTINFSRDKSMIVDLEDGLETYSLGDSWGVYLYAKKDRPWGTLVGTGFQYNDNGEALVGADGFPLIAQNQEIGNVMPDWLMGWSNEFSYKNWSFGFLLDYRHGGDLFSQTLMFGAYSGLLDFTAADGVRENGAVFGQNICPDITFVNEDGSPNTTAVDPEDAFMYYFNINEMSVIDGSFLKLREIHLTYTFPERWVKKMRIISDAKISLVANNVAILWLHKSNLAKIDPESLIGNSTQSMAFETAYMPQTRSIGVKLHLAF